MGLHIRRVTIAEMEAQPHIYTMLEEYAAESAIKGLPHPAAKASTYKNLEAIGTLVSFGAFDEERLIGYINVMLPVLPHFDQMIAVSESFFVLKEFRKTGAGLKLLRIAETFSFEKGSPGFLVSAPLFGDLCDVLPSVGYVPTSCVFFKNLASPARRIPRMDHETIAKVSLMEAALKKFPQTEIPVQQSLHAGVYSRTVKIPAGIVITGAHIKIPTMLVVQGDAIMYIGDDRVELNGYNVLSAEADRKQAFYARSDVYLTMMFASKAGSVEEAEEEFTDEAALLQTRMPSLEFSSGEQKCLV